MIDLDRPVSATAIIAHRSPISGIDWDGGAHVATAGYDSRLILWDADQRTPLHVARHDHLVNQCRFSPDRRLIVSASSDYLARIWTADDLAPVAVLAGHRDDVEMASWSRCGRFVATASRDRMIRLFDRSGALLRTLQGHDADVLSVEWLAGGAELASSSDDGTIRRWRADDGAEIACHRPGVETDTIAIAPDGRIFAGNDAGEILVLGRGGAERVPAHAAGIKRLALDPTGRRLMSAGYDRTVRLWTIGGDGRLYPEQTTEAPPIVWLRAACFAGPDRLVFGSFGSAYAEYDAAARHWRTDHIGDTPGLNACCVLDEAVFAIGDAGIVRRDGVPVRPLGSLCNFLHPWEGMLVTGGQLGLVFDALTGRILHRHHAPLNCAASWGDGAGARLVIGSYMGEGLVFAPGPDGPAFLGAVQLHDNAVKGLAAGGGQLFSVCATGAAALHATADLAPLARIVRAHDKIANAAAALPDGRFASVGRDLTLRLWRDGVADIVATPHDHSIKCLAVLPGTSMIATGAYDGRLAIYDWARGRWPVIRQISRFGVSSLAADPLAGVFVASCYGGRTYRIPPRI
jgi:WD40 repeat protein